MATLNDLIEILCHSRLSMLLVRFYYLVCYGLLRLLNDICYLCRILLFISLLTMLVGEVM